ncbi:hypothetical protein LXL04_007744 [Taraxacum kok-saghyz]
MIPFDENDPEVIARRIKNKERQRRYRARKRQEADMKRACDIPQSIQPELPQSPQSQSQTETLVKVNNNNTPRVYSQRNWKKDARIAHLLKQQQQPQQQHNGSTSTSPIVDLNCLGNRSSFVDSREVSSAPSGRNWKAEARNKMK